MRGMRWYHFGFAFFWALYSTGPFGNAAVAQAAAQMLGQSEPGSFFVCAELSQASLIVSLIVFVILYRRREKVGWRFGWVMGVAMCAGFTLRWVAPCAGAAELPVAYAGAIVIGAASGIFMLAWQSFFANAGTERAVVCVPLSAVFSVLLSGVISIMPAIAGAVCLALLLPAAASVSLMLSLRDTKPYPAEPLTRSSFRSLVSDMALPVICVCVVGFVWKVVGHLNGGTSPMEALAASAGMVVAALLVAGLELFWKRGFDIMRLYQFVFPIITGALMLAVFLGSEWMPFVSGCLMCGFEILNLILIITCAAYAGERNLKPSQVYVPCVGLALVALLVGDIAGSAAGPHALHDMTIMAGALFACAYLLVLVMSLVAFALGKGSRVDSAGEGVPVAEGDADDSTDQAEDKRAVLESAIAALGPADPVSQREIDVLELYLQGCNVPTAAQKLFISENTVRSHTKSLYRKFGVHSRQELIGLFSA